MRIAIDHSPLVSSHRLADKIRGTGFYVRNLIDSLKKYHPEHEYVLFTQGEKLSNIDIFHYPYFEPFFISLPFFAKKKTIVTIHDLTPLVLPSLFPAGIKGKIKFQIQKMRVKSSAAIITDSESSKKDIETILKIPSSRVFSVPLAAGEQYRKEKISEKIKKEILEKYKIPEKFVLYVGDATPNKNIKRLVEAAIEGEFSLAMVGGALVKQDVDATNGWNNELVFVQNQAKVSKNIHLLGFVPDEDLLVLYNIATVFVFPTLYEGFGLPVLEAASCGCPVVTTHKGSVTEVIEKAAELVDPYSVSSIKDGVLKVFHSTVLQKKLSEQGLDQAKKFTWQKTSDATVKVYEEVFRKA